MAQLRKKVLPGFGLSLGYTMTYLSLIVLIPLAVLLYKSARLSPSLIAKTLSDPLTLAAFNLTLWTSLVAAFISAFFGLIIAWTLVRYRFPGRRIFDAIIDLPFALPTAVAGLTFSTLFMPTGWIGGAGRWLATTWAWTPLSHLWNGLAWLLNHSVIWILEHLFNAGLWVLNAGLSLFHGQVNYAHWQLNDATPDFLCFSNTNGGIVIVLTFVGFPFVVRAVQPVLQEWQVEYEQAAASLGAGRWTTFRRVIWPEIRPAMLTGLALAFARAVGEYGSVIFISSNLPGRGEIVPQRIVSELFALQDDSEGRAHVIAAALLLLSLAVLLSINLFEWWTRRKAERART